MGTQIIISVVYVIIIIAVELFIEKRLNKLKELHQQKIWWGYASKWISKINNHLKILIRIIFLILCFIGSTLTFILL